MVIELVDQLVILLESDAKPDQIAIIAPYLDGALRYSLASALEKAAIPYRITRRRSTPREEPRVRAWITWLALAHPSWNHHPTVYEVAEALYLSVASLDPARAQLTAEQLYDEGMSRLLPVSMLDETLQARVGKNQLNLVDELRLWLSENGEHKYSIDGFLARLFYELLALPRYQPRPDYAGAAICDWLVKAAVRLRKAAPALGMTDPIAAGSAFIDSINQGIVSTSPPDFGHPPDPEGITIATMYGYLLSEKPVKWQVWLDVGSSGWWDIPRQPLSNAFVLSRRWQEGQPWTARDDFEIRNQLLGRIIAGLTNRCHEGVILAMSDIDRRGIRQEGALLRALQAIL
jgi:hypothetical protein